MAREPEVPAYWLHCINLTGLGGRPQMLAQPGGEAGLLALAADADIGGREPGAHSSVLTEQEVDPCRLTGDVLGDAGGGPCEGAGVRWQTAAPPPPACR